MQRGSSKTRSGKVEHATFQCTDGGKHAAKAVKTSAAGIECGTETASRIINFSIEYAKVAAKVKISKSNGFDMKSISLEYFGF